MPPKRKSARTTTVDDDSDVAKKAKTGLQVGDSIRELDIVLKDQDDQEVKACGFRDMFEQIQSAGYQVFGVSRDTVTAQKNFAVKQNLPFKLLSDPDGLLITALGANGVLNKVIRSHWIINAEGNIEVAETKVTPKNSFTKTVEFVKSKAGKDVDINQEGLGESPEHLVSEAKKSLKDKPSTLENIVDSAAKQPDMVSSSMGQKDGMEKGETKENIHPNEVQSVPNEMSPLTNGASEQESDSQAEAIKEKNFKPSEEVNVEEHFIP